MENYWAKNPFVAKSVNLIAFQGNERALDQEGVGVLETYFQESCFTLLSFRAIFPWPCKHGTIDF